MSAVGHLEFCSAKRETVVHLAQLHKTVESMPSLPEIRSLPELPAEERAGVLDLLFEPSGPLHSLCLESLAKQGFSSWDELIALVGFRLSALAKSQATGDILMLDSILGSHPRLGEKKIDSAQSRAEQVQLHAAGNAGSNDESERLAALNRDYERAYPGLRYVVFVNGRGRDVIMEDMKRRIEHGGIEAERAAAIRVE